MLCKISKSSIVLIFFQSENQPEGQGMPQEAKVNIWHLDPATTLVRGLCFCSPLNILQGDIQGSMSEVVWLDHNVKGEPGALLLPGSGLQHLAKLSLT